MSFDVILLFTNVPLDKTIDIILRKIHMDKRVDTTILKRGINELLYVCTKNPQFSFEVKFMYTLICSYGFPFRTCTGKYFHSRTWNVIIPCLDKMWKRYVDDTIHFAKVESMSLTITTTNSFHSNIKFTIEIDLLIPSLDVLFIKTLNGIHITVYRNKWVLAYQFIGILSHQTNGSGEK